MHVAALSVQADHSGPQFSDFVAVVTVVIIGFPLALGHEAVKQISHSGFRVLLLEILLAIGKWVMITQAHEQFVRTESTDDFWNDRL